MAERRFDVSAGGALLLALLLLTAEARLLWAMLPGIVFHELGHILALRLCGARILQLRLEFCGFCLISTAVCGRGEAVFCALAGSVGGLFWAAVAGALGGDFFYFSAGLSLLLSLYNLLPALPLDGGRALMALTGRVELLRLTTVLSAALLLALALWAPLPTLLIPSLWLWLEGIRA